MNFKIAVLPGDGIGPEIVEQAVKSINAIGRKFNHSFEYEYALVGAVAIDRTGSPLPDDTLIKCKAADAVLFGAIGDPRYDNDPSAKVRPEQGLLAMRLAVRVNGGFQRGQVAAGRLLNLLFLELVLVGARLQMGRVRVQDPAANQLAP